MTLIQQLRCFAKDFRRDLYAELQQPSNREFLKKFFHKEISFKKAYKHNYNYTSRKYEGYLKRKIDQKGHIRPAFSIFSPEEYRSEKEHDDAIKTLQKYYSSIQNNEVALSEEEWCKRLNSTSYDVEAFNLMNNLMSQTRSDILPVKVSLDIKYNRSNNLNYRRNNSSKDRTYRKVN